MPASVPEALVLVPDAPIERGRLLLLPLAMVHNTSKYASKSFERQQSIILYISAELLRTLRGAISCIHYPEICSRHKGGSVPIFGAPDFWGTRHDIPYRYRPILYRPIYCVSGWSKAYSSGLLLLCAAVLLLYRCTCILLILVVFAWCYMLLLPSL